ncbi:Cyclin-like F-box [Penicillium digitatum]|uniref:F-box domain-containing protein n=3 Tax=Penicillium digitatum TaxID=36651 RepID=K9G4Y3_PEND2|nr:hypothetical protein PDIP_15730 [Penicillium digitatum Pd1]EKV15977.1 hypothetical protein PDIG_23320 [Penicillium digitatum PHI26]EKV20489.1 hypothetical protein PDIP_15730 [Penicillium digitatum Pd1]QQK39911.1 Cyclin-like F-box [Penicillium digitatum]
MDSTTQPILEGFLALRDNSSRRAAFNGILDNLTSHEIREVKSRLETMTFQCDLLDKLPLELVTVLVKYLDLAELVLLRRVSKRWRAMLSSTIVITAAIRCHMGKSVIQPDFILADFDALIKKRLRAERGMPAIVATIPYDLPPEIDDELNRDGISYCNGVCAWIEQSTDRTTIFMVDLPSGKTRTLTTVNREGFTHVQVSDTLVSATSTRGYCHVWNIPKEEHKSFRIPSLQFAHYISIGSKVMLSYADSVLHFCFDSGVARVIKIRPFILLLSPHAKEDGFFVVCIRRKNGNDSQLREDGSLLWKYHHFQIQKFSVHENKFICTWEQYRELPFRDEKLWGFQCEPGDTTLPCRASLRCGQSSALLGYYTTESDRTRNQTDDLPLQDGVEYGSLSLSFEANDRITVHFRPAGLNFESPHANLDYSAQGRGLIYCFEEHNLSKKTILHIGCEFSELSHVRNTKACRFASSHALLFPDERSCTSVLGDGDFVIFPTNGEVWIWCFDDTWLPSGIPHMRITTW